MHGKAACSSLLLVLFLALSLAANNSNVSEPTQPLVSRQQELGEKVEGKCSQPSEPTVNLQLLSLISDIAGVGTYLKEQMQESCNTIITITRDLENLKNELQSAKTEQQATQLELNITKIDLQATKDNLEISKSNQQTMKDDLWKTREEREATLIQLQNTTADLKITKDQLQTTKTDLQNTKADLQYTKAEVEVLKSNPGGSSFVRWGRKDCPGNTSLVYSGLAGGDGGTNRLCLSREPEFDHNIITFSDYAEIFGAKYTDSQDHHDHAVPCSLCHVQQSSTIMVPGTRTCPPTWTPQYHGHLAYGYRASADSEYDCLDQEPQSEDNLESNGRGNMFYYTKTYCGSLRCPPYEDGKIVTCVVCSK